MPQKEQIELYVAIIDGDDPASWKIFNKMFPEILAKALRQAEPLGVPSRLTDRYEIQLRPLWAGPKELLAQDYLSKVVGVIIDGDPVANSSVEFQRKLDVLRDLYVQQKSGPEVLFKRFGYRVWFLTSDSKSSEFGRFNENVRDALGSRINDAAILRYPIVPREELLAPVLSEYLADAYYSIDREA